MDVCLSLPYPHASSNMESQFVPEAIGSLWCNSFTERAVAWHGFDAAGFKRTDSPALDVIFIVVPAIPSQSELSQFQRDGLFCYITSDAPWMFV